MFSRIAVHLDDQANSSTRLALSIALAQEHDAALVGIYPDFNLPVYPFDESVVSRPVIAELQRQAQVDREAQRLHFQRMTKAAGVNWLLMEPLGWADASIALQAHYVDLLVLGVPLSSAPTRAGYAVAIPNFVESIVMAAGRPVLLIPDVDPPPNFGEHVLLCWDSSREAARALADAGPFLHNARSISILFIDQAEADEARFRDGLNAYCAAHLYCAPTFIRRKQIRAGVGAAILETADELGCDLIAMGAFAHSRLRDFVFGGATQGVLHNMRQAVVVSH